MDEHATADHESLAEVAKLVEHWRAHSKNYNIGFAAGMNRCVRELELVLEGRKVADL